MARAAAIAVFLPDHTGGATAGAEPDGGTWGWAEGTVGGTVRATLSLSLGAPAPFGASTPGLAPEY